jgi:hypothetical protein
VGKPSHPKLARKIIGFDLVVLAQDGKTLHEVSSSDIAGPGITQKEIPGCGWNGKFLALFLPAEPAQEMFGQKQDVLSPVAKWRQMQGNDIQAIKQILPEASLSDALGQIPVCGGDHAHIDAQGFGTAYALELLLLQDAEQFDLRVRCEFADLVEKDGPPSASSNGPGGCGWPR